MPVAVSVVVAAVLRVIFALMTSTRFTPWDVGLYFKATAEAVVHGRDPLMTLPGREWNFLELMPYVHALELESGLPWVFAVKIAPIAADLVLVWIVSRLAGEQGRTRALQYAVNPLSLLVASLHGQVEPVALALALGGVLLLRRDRPVLAGILLGAAVAAKTWPIVILVAVLPLRQPRQAAKIVAGSAVAPVACLASGVIFLGTNVPHALSRLISYSGFVDNWTWSGTLMLLGHKGGIGYSSPFIGPAALLIVAGVFTTLCLVRRRPPEARALGALAAVLVCTAGFGTQYLFWVLPLTIALSARWRNQYVIAASAWAATAYLVPFGTAVTRDFLIGLSWLPAALLVAIIAEQARRTPAELAGAPGRPAEALAAGAPPPTAARRPELVRAGTVPGTGWPDKDVPAAS